MAGTERSPRVPPKSGSRDKARAQVDSDKTRLKNEINASNGQPLDRALRTTMEARDWSRAVPTAGKSGYSAMEGAAEHLAHSSPASLQGNGADFASVRLHSDQAAAAAARRLGARAFTIGEHIYTDPIAQPSAEAPRSRMMAHELAHVAQQRRTGQPMIQPQLRVTGSQADIDRFIAIAEPAMGEQLAFDAATGTINVIGNLAAPATSAAFGTAMHQIIDDPAQDAEANFGTAQAGVAVGAFPQPSDMTGATQQQIDIDDVENIEAGAPGSGVAKLAHELTENYVAHGTAAVAGVDLFPVSHDAGLSAESDVSEQTVGPGRRVADVTTPLVANVQTRVQDFETYYLVFDLTLTPAASDFAVSNARHAPRVNVSTQTIDSFVSGSAAVPAAGAAAVAAAAADVAANPTATVRIEGFTDDQGTAVQNVLLSNDRASAALAALVAAGAGAGRIHAVGLGQTGPVAANDTDAHRAQNRRVVITVDRPGP